MTRTTDESETDPAALDGESSAPEEQDEGATGVGAVVEKVKNTRIMRAMTRYGTARGGLLAGGIAYSAFFSIAAALTIAVTAFSFFLKGRPDIQDQLFEGINNALPGILKTDENPTGLVSPSALIIDKPVNLATIISTIVLVWSAMSIMAALQTSIRAVFGISKLPQNAVVGKLLNLAGFVVLGIGLVLGIAASAGASFFAHAIFDWLGVSGPTAATALRWLAFGVGVLVDATIFAFLFRVTASVRIPRRDLLIGTLLGGLASSLLRFVGTTAVGSVASNPVLAPFAAIVTILLWLNLIARITLIVAAFTANPPLAPAIPEPWLVHARETPNYVTLTAPETLDWKHDPVTGVLVPDESLDPEKAKVEPIPPWKGIRARLARRRVEKAEEALIEAEDSLSQARADYAAGARAAHKPKTRRTTQRI